MMLVWNWKDITAKAWSVYALYVAAALDGAVILMEVLGDRLPITIYTYAAIRAVLTVVAFIARVLVQRNLPEG